jgi:hypothetical protein
MGVSCNTSPSNYLYNSKSINVLMEERKERMHP